MGNTAAVLLLSAISRPTIQQSDCCLTQSGDMDIEVSMCNFGGEVVCFGIEYELHQHAKEQGTALSYDVH